MGEGVVTPLHPSFFLVKIFEYFFHSWIHEHLDKGWVNWPSGNPRKKAKMARAKLRKEGGCNNSPGQRALMDNPFPKDIILYNNI